MNEKREIDLTIFSSSDWTVMFLGNEKIFEHHRINFGYRMAYLTPMVNLVMSDDETRINFFSYYIEDKDMEEVSGSNDIKEYLRKVDW